MGLFTRSNRTAATMDPRRPANPSAAAAAAAPAPPAPPEAAAPRPGGSHLFTAAARPPGRAGPRPRPPTAAPAAATPAPAAAPVSHERQVYLQGLKAKIHHKLVERLDTQTLRTMPPEQVRNEVRVLIRELCQGEKGLINSADQEKLMDDVMDETFGLGPLEILLKDPTISDILVNRWDRIFCERRGRLDLSEVTFRDNAHLRQIIDRIVGRIGRRVDETSPMVDARLADGSRVNAIIPPLALDGPAMSIRRFGSKPLKVEDLIRHGAFPQGVMDFLSAAVQARCNIIISGGTGSGKTTLLNSLSRYIPGEERVITIEDAAELQLQQQHVVRLETRPMNIEGKGEVNMRELVKNCLRMRPDRIIIGECRGGEAMDMLQAMNTGHDGQHDHGPRQHAPGRHEPVGSDDRHGRVRHPDQGPADADRQRRADRDPGPPDHRRQAEGDQRQRDHGHGGREPADARDLQLRAERRGPGGAGRRPVRRHRHPPQGRRADRDAGDAAAVGPVRPAGDGLET